MLETLTNLLFKQSPTGEPLPEQDTAYADDALLTSGKFTQYNPDDLITRKGYRIYKKMMTDEQVKAVVRFHRDAVTGREWTFEDHAELSPEENERRATILNEAIRQMPGSFKTKLDMVMSALYNGFSMVEKTYKLIEVDGKAWAGIKNLTLKPFDTIYFDLDDFGNLEAVHQYVAGYEVELDIKRFIHYACNPDVHEYYGQSELREAYRAWWSKDTTILLQNIFLERAAAGFVWATPSEKSSLTAKSPEYSQLQTVLSKIRSTSSMILPKHIELNVQHPQDTQAFDRAITAHDKAIAKALLMPNLLGLSEQGPNGSRALGDTQLEAFLWMLDAEAKQVEETINEQLFAELAALNFPDGLHPRWVLKDLSNKQTMEIITKWNELVKGKVVRKTTDDEDHIRASLGFPEYDEEKEIQPPPPPPGLNPGQEEGDEEDGQGQEGDDDDGGQPNPVGEEEELAADHPDETIVGKGRKRISAEMSVKKALKRVDFAVIDERTTKAGDEQIKAVSGSLTEAFTKAFDELPEAYAPEDINTLDFSKRDKTKVNNQFKAMLRSGWQIGVKHAKDEVGKAAGKTFSINFERLDQNAAEYFQSRAFFLTGNLTHDMMKTAKNVLLNGMKDNRTRKQIRDDIYEAFAKAGFITNEDAQAQMGRILTAHEGTTPRLNTIIRTNTFEAVNEARYSYFTDPELDDFVEALEYSAVLDSRTTGICQHLDGHVHKAQGGVWDEGYRPPNHFNCRSLLVPVTAVDAWEESPAPEVFPQEGFA